MQTKPPTKKQLHVFIVGLSIILLVFSGKLYKADNIKSAFLCIAIACLLIIIYLIKKDFVIKFYIVWMQCISFVGMFVTGFLIVLLFYFVFSPVGIFLRLIRKDILNLNKNPKLKTYWIDKPQNEFKKENYERQF